ncbi:MAG: hypothetical protein ILO42_03345 [Clostridia bacterium]|nr:hypothetical protein [Clostridia bacterium]MBP5269975.1 hypothetical protein [Clostridia bacterium]
MKDGYVNDNPEIFSEDSSGLSEASPKKKSPMILARILSVAVALLVWLYVVNTTSDDYEKTFTLIPIRVEGEEALAAAGAMSVYDLSETVVSVTVSGRRTDINQLDSSDFKAWIDVGGITESGRHSLQVKLSLPDNVSAISHTPSEVSVLADARIEKTVPIKVNLLSYSINDNLFIAEMNTSIGEVRVTGPAAAIDKIAAAEAEVDLSSGWITSSFMHNAKLIPVDSDGNRVQSEYISLSADSADVSVRVLMKASKPLSVLLSPSLDPSEYSVTVTPQTLTVVGDVFAVSRIESINVATVGEDYPSESSFKASTVVLPLGISFLEGSADITVKVVYTPSVTTQEETSVTAPETTLPETTVPDVTTGAETVPETDVSSEPEDITSSPEPVLSP